MANQQICEEKINVSVVDPNWFASNTFSPKFHVQ
jgi:hypothetical protein